MRVFLVNLNVLFGLQIVPYSLWLSHKTHDFIILHSVHRIASEKAPNHSLFTLARARLWFYEYSLAFSVMSQSLAISHSLSYVCAFQKWRDQKTNMKEIYLAIKTLNEIAGWHVNIYHINGNIQLVSIEGAKYFDWNGKFIEVTWNGNRKWFSTIFIFGVNHLDECATNSFVFQHTSKLVCIFGG